MNQLTVSSLFDLSKTLAVSLLSAVEYPWETLPRLKEFIRVLGSELSKEDFYSPFEGVYISESAQIAPNTVILPPCIIDAEAEVRHGAFIRGSVIIGKRAVVGNSCELKNCILFDQAKAPHFNYIGDSVLGYKAHLGAGVILSNQKSDKSAVVIRSGEIELQTDLKKAGSFIGDCAEIGCNSVLNPGCVIGKSSVIYPLSSVRGYIPPKCIYKSNGCIADKF